MPHGCRPRPRPRPLASVQRLMMMGGATRFQRMLRSTCRALHAVPGAVAGVGGGASVVGSAAADHAGPAAIPVLNAQQALAAAADRRAGSENNHLVAMYSSYHRGIITDPGLMALPVDDHMANRGHGMFDTGTFRGGRFYRLGAHVARILRNADRVGIKHDFTKERLIDIICQTVRSTELQDGAVRYYLTAGHGGFSWLPDECVEAGFYCIVIRDIEPPLAPEQLTLEKEFTAEARFLRPQFLGTCGAGGGLCAVSAIAFGGSN
jgi:hypothetical protein